MSFFSSSSLCIQSVMPLAKTYWSYRVTTKDGENMSALPWPMTTKSIGIFICLLHLWTIESMLKRVWWYYKKVWENSRYDLDLWSVDPKSCRCLPLLALRLCMKCELSRLKTFWLTELQQNVAEYVYMTDLCTQKFIGVLLVFHLCMK